jgi:hypothetical protein
MVSTAIHRFVCLQGSMMGPHWNAKATEIAIVTDGSGIVQSADGVPEKHPVGRAGEAATTTVTSGAAGREAAATRTKAQATARHGGAGTRCSA